MMSLYALQGYILLISTFVGISTIVYAQDPEAKCATTGPRCMNTTQCTGRTDGVYQWCGDCGHYLRCIGGIGTVYEFFNPPYNVWDDNKKNFDLTSTTCVECYYTCPPGPSAPTVPYCERTGHGCIAESCTPGSIGSFQYCRNCEQYVNCTVTGIWSLHLCPENQYFDDFFRACRPASTTCRECYDTCYPPTTQEPTTVIPTTLAPTTVFPTTQGITTLESSTVVTIQGGEEDSTSPRWVDEADNSTVEFVDLSTVQYSTDVDGDGNNGCPTTAYSLFVAIHLLTVSFITRALSL